MLINLIFIILLRINKNSLLKDCLIKGSPQYHNKRNTKEETGERERERYDNI